MARVNPFALVLLVSVPLELLWHSSRDYVWQNVLNFLDHLFGIILRSVLLDLVFEGLLLDRAHPMMGEVLGVSPRRCVRRHSLVVHASKLLPVSYKVAAA